MSFLRFVGGIESCIYLINVVAALCRFAWIEARKSFGRLTETYRIISDIQTGCSKIFEVWALWGALRVRVTSRANAWQHIHMSPEFTAAVGIHNRSRKRLDILSANVVLRYQSL